MLLTYEENSSHEVSAYQVSLIPIGLAANHQMIEYRQLCRQMKFGVSPMLSNPLGHIVNWCIRKGLPALTSLVVKKETGKPSHRWTVGWGNELSVELQRVFAFDWLSIMPPMLTDLREY